MSRDPPLVFMKTSCFELYVSHRAGPIIDRILTGVIAASAYIFADNTDATIVMHNIAQWLITNLK